MEISAPLLVEIDALVAQGRFATREMAVDTLLRLGLAALKEKRIPTPARPPPPPGVNEPSDDRPIGVDPKTDVNWI